MSCSSMVPRTHAHAGSCRSRATGQRGGVSVLLLVTAKASARGCGSKGNAATTATARTAGDSGAWSCGACLAASAM